MKRSLLILAASLSFLSPALAEIIEGNVSIQLRLTREEPQSATSTSLNTKLVTSTFKNADFIQAMSVVKGGTPFSKSAKIIYRFDGGLDYYIRDKDQTDFKVSEYLSIAPNGGLAGSFSVASKKLKFQESNPEGTKIGTEKHLAAGTLGIATIHENDSNPTTMLGHGILTQSARHIRSKENPERSIFVTNLSMSAAGSFVFPVQGGGAPDLGVLQGSVKFTGTKILPTPVVPET